jgi:hypothetical protein
MNRIETRTIAPITLVYRLVNQPINKADRSLSFNPQSIGRASPITNDGESEGVMYLADSPYTAFSEVLHHVVQQEKILPNATLSKQRFKDMRLLVFEVISPLIVRVMGDDFSGSAADYSKTRALAQSTFDADAKLNGLAWFSARMFGCSLVLFESRNKLSTSLKLVSNQPLLDKPYALRFITSALALKEIHFGSP